MVITPTPGRVVWFYRSVSEASDPSIQPLPAIVTKTFGERLVNLALFSENGDSSPKLSVQLYQEDDEDPKGEFACWMPYQSNQAKRVEEPRLSVADVQKIVGELFLARDFAQTQVQPVVLQGGSASKPADPGVGEKSPPVATPVKQVTK